MIDIPRGEAPNFLIDVPKIQAAVSKYKPKLLFLTSPNNPDGSLISSEDIATLLALPVLVVLDEAYIEFCDSTESRMKDVLSHENLIVLRTFSKRAALAGKSILHILMTCSDILIRFASRLWCFPSLANGLFVARETTVQRISCCRNFRLCRIGQSGVP